MFWYKKFFSNYANFNGRARRSEFWYPVLINAFLIFVCSIIDALFIGLPILQGMLLLVIFLPSLAVTVRRYHDIGKSGAWFLIQCIPCIGGFIHLYFMLQDSERGKNRWGPNPKKQGRSRGRRNRKKSLKGRRHDFDDDSDDGDDEELDERPRRSRKATARKSRGSSATRERRSSGKKVRSNPAKRRKASGKTTKRPRDAEDEPRSRKKGAASSPVKRRSRGAGKGELKRRRRR